MGLMKIVRKESLYICSIHFYAIKSIEIVLLYISHEFGLYIKN